MTLSTFVSSLNFLTIGPWEFNGFDAVVLVILVISGLYAMSRGLLREVISLAALLIAVIITLYIYCLLYTSPSPRDQRGSRMPSSA